LEYTPPSIEITLEITFFSVPKSDHGLEGRQASISKTKYLREILDFVLT
jgi:hypothetical protein